MLRFHMIVLGLSTLIAVARCNFAEDYFRFKGTQTVTKQVDLEGVKTIEISVGSTDIAVVHGDQPQATFQIRKTCRAKDVKSGAELMAKVNLTIDKVDGVLKAEEVHEDKGVIGGFTKGWVSLDVTLTIPKGLDLRIKLGSGDVDINDFSGDLMVICGSGDISIGRIEGDADFVTGSGDIDLNEIKGDVRCRTGSGTVSLGMVDGNAWINTGSGDISVMDATGDLSVRTASGSVSIRSRQGSLRVNTGSGDVVAESQAHKAEIDIKATSGSVLLTLAHIESLDLDIRTNSGSIYSQVPVQVTKPSPNRLLGCYGDGDLKVRVRTSSGDITVKQESV